MPIGFSYRQFIDYYQRLTVDKDKMVLKGKIPVPFCLKS